VEAWTIIPVAAIVMWGVQGIARAMFAHRAPPPLPAVPDEGVRAELEALRQRMAEIEERQDFTERMLARGSYDPSPGDPRAS
jgi:hypothetical protein